VFRAGPLLRQRDKRHFVRRGQLPEQMEGAMMRSAIQRPRHVRVENKDFHERLN